MLFDIESSSDLAKAKSIHKIAHDLTILYLKDEIKEVSHAYNHESYPSDNADAIIKEYIDLRNSFIYSLENHENI